MSISSVVADLTEVIASCLGPLSPWEIRLSDQLRSMGQHLSSGDLGSWESVFRDIWFVGPEHEKTNGEAAAHLLGLVFDFGRFNISAAFDTEGTRREYEKLVAELNSALGTALDTTGDVSVW